MRGSGLWLFQNEPCYWRFESQIFCLHCRVWLQQTRPSRHSSSTDRRPIDNRPPVCAWTLSTKNLNAFFTKAQRVSRSLNNRPRFCAWTLSTTNSNAFFTKAAWIWTRFHEAWIYYLCLTVYPVSYWPDMQYIQSLLAADSTNPVLPDARYLHYCMKRRCQDRTVVALLHKTDQLMAPRF